MPCWSWRYCPFKGHMKKIIESFSYKNLAIIPFNLCQGSAIEVMLLRTALRYDKEQDAIMFGNEQPYTRKQLQEGGIGDLVDPMYNFARSMSELDLDYAEYVLLMAITILSSGMNTFNLRLLSKFNWVLSNISSFAWWKVQVKTVCGDTMWTISLLSK